MTSINDLPFDELAVRLAEAAQHEPLFQRFALKCNAGRNTVHTPDDVLGERLIRVIGCLLNEVERPGQIRINTPDDRRHEFLLAFARYALAASPYLISEEVRHQVGRLAIPRHTLSPRLLPSPRMWVTFETAIQIGRMARARNRAGQLVGPDDDVDIAVDWQMLIDHVDCFDLILGGQVEGDPFIQADRYQYGKTYPDDFGPQPDDPAVTGTAGQLPSALALLGFLASPYIPVRRQRASRAARRETARVGGAAADPEVTFIVLRRPEPRRRDEAADEQDVAWKHRWIVSGHLRAQWYPSEQAHRLIWIAPYMKGPEDAPLLDHVYRVAR